MADNKESELCPKCQTEVNNEDDRWISAMGHCPNCGYEFSTGKEGVGPIDFAFASTSNAYKPSGIGSISDYILMLLFGCFVAIIGGSILYDLLNKSVNFFAHLFGSVPMHAILHLGLINAIFIIIAEIITFLVIPIFLTFMLGAFLGAAISYAARVTKCRNTTAATIIGIFSGIVGFLVFYDTYYEGRIYNPVIIEPLVLLLSFVSIIVGAILSSTNLIEETPFCEDCEEYMKKFILEKIPIRLESILINNLKSGKLEELNSMFTLNNINNYSSIAIWLCDSCWNNGFINVETTQARIKERYEKVKSGNDAGKVKKFEDETTWTQLIFSEHIGNEEIDQLKRSGILENNKLQKAK